VGYRICFSNISLNTLHKDDNRDDDDADDDDDDNNNNNKVHPRTGHEGP
jgi:hypothetical protein